jgi:hypothetical protein
MPNAGVIGFSTPFRKAIISHYPPMDDLRADTRTVKRGTDAPTYRDSREGFIRWADVEPFNRPFFRRRTK